MVCSCATIPKTSGKSGTSLFDSFGQLTASPTPSWQATTGSQDLNGRNFGWTYDLAGNRTAETGAVATSYTPNALNQYASITGALWEGSPLYDDDGNMTIDSTWSYSYDGENRLTSMTRTGQSLSFTYDYMGRRIRKTVTGTNASDTKFLWNGWKLAAELAANGTDVNRTFVWGADFSDAHGAAGGAGSLLAQIDGGAVTYAVPDAFGNIVGYLNSGALNAAVEYSPFGRVLNTYGSATSFPIGYSGQYTDWETGLVYYGLRYYMPKHGRFINRDPIEEQGGLNLYGFCQNSPTNLHDSLGLTWKRAAAGMPQWARDIVNLIEVSFAGRSGCNGVASPTTWDPQAWAENQAWTMQYEAEHVWDSNGKNLGLRHIYSPATSSASSGSAPNSGGSHKGTVSMPATAYKDANGNWRSTEDGSLINGGAGYGSDPKNSASTIDIDYTKTPSYTPWGKNNTATLFPWLSRLNTPAPSFPKDYTNIFNAQLQQTWNVFSAAALAIHQTAPLGTESAMRLEGFRSMVTDHAAFDLKTNPNLPYNSQAMGGDYALYNGMIFYPNDFGNYNYGVAAKAFGFSLATARYGAEVNQLWKNGSFDTQRSQDMIIQGYNHFP